jgi:hypothetical protein
MTMALRILAFFTMLFSLVNLYLYASPYRNANLPSTLDHSLSLRDGPVFPNDPPSCPICAGGYSNISSCAQAAPVLANFTMVRHTVTVLSFEVARCQRATIANRSSSTLGLSSMSLSVPVRILSNPCIPSASTGKCFGPFLLSLAHERQLHTNQSDAISGSGWWYFFAFHRRGHAQCLCVGKHAFGRRRHC